MHRTPRFTRNRRFVRELSQLHCLISTLRIFFGDHKKFLQVLFYELFSGCKERAPWGSFASFSTRSLHDNKSRKKEKNKKFSRFRKWRECRVDDDVHGPQQLIKLKFIDRTRSTFDRWEGWKKLYIYRLDVPKPGRCLMVFSHISFGNHNKSTQFSVSCHNSLSDRSKSRTTSIHWLWEKLN